MQVPMQRQQYHQRPSYQQQAAYVRQAYPQQAVRAQPQFLRQQFPQESLPRGYPRMQPARQPIQLQYPVSHSIASQHRATVTETEQSVDLIEKRVEETLRELENSSIEDKTTAKHQTKLQAVIRAAKRPSAMSRESHSADSETITLLYESFDVEKDVVR